MLVKLLIKMACVCVIAIGGVSYMMSTQGQDPLAKLRDFSPVMPDVSMPALPDLPDIPNIAFKPAKAAKTTVYRWTDDHGVTQFSSSPPQSGQNFKAVEIDPNTNVIAAHPIPEPEPESGIETASHKIPDDSSELPTYKDMGEIRQQLDQIKAINENRISDLNALIQQQK